MDQQELIRTIFQHDFSRLERSEKEKYLPSILSVAVDFIHIRLDDENTGVPIAVSIACKDEAVFPQNAEPIVENRRFYIYEDCHRLVFSPAEELPAELQIKNQRVKGSRKRDMDAGTEALDGKVVKEIFLERDVFLKYYAGKCWDGNYAYSFENYSDLLPIIFFFNEEILCCAIRTEYENKRHNPVIVRAIKRCLELYRAIDMLRRENGLNGEEKVIRYNRFHYIHEIEKAVADQEEKYGGKWDYIERLEDIVNNGLTCIHIETGTAWKRMKVARVLGIRNYRYVKTFKGKNELYENRIS